MAPRRTGGGSSSSSGDSGSSIDCGSCLDAVDLYGSNWHDATTDALFVFNILTLAALVVALVLAGRFKWTSPVPMKKDKLRNRGFVVSTIFAFLYFLLLVIVTGLQESETRVTRLFYIIYPIEWLLQYVAELVLLGIILRTLHQKLFLSSPTSSPTGLARTMPKYNVSIILLLAFMSFTGGIFYIVHTVFIVRGYNYYQNPVDPNTWPRIAYIFQVVYHVLAFLAAVGVQVGSLFVLMRERSFASMLLAFIIAPALLLRWLFDLAYYGVIVSSYNDYVYVTTAAYNYLFAGGFLYCIFTIALYLGVAILGDLTPTNHHVNGHSGPSDLGGADGKIVHNGGKNGNWNGDGGYAPQAYQQNGQNGQMPPYMAQQQYQHQQQQQQYPSNYGPVQGGYQSPPPQQHQQNQQWRG